MWTLCTTISGTPKRTLHPWGRTECIAPWWRRWHAAHRAAPFSSASCHRYRALVWTTCIKYRLQKTNTGRWWQALVFKINFLNFYFKKTVEKRKRMLGFVFCDYLFTEMFLRADGRSENRGGGHQYKCLLIWVPDSVTGSLMGLFLLHNGIFLKITIKWTPLALFHQSCFLSDAVRASWQRHLLWSP